LVFTHINEIKGTNRTLENISRIIFEVSQFYRKINKKVNLCFKEPQQEFNKITQILENFVFNFPSNFKIYFNNYKDNKKYFDSLISQIKHNNDNPFILGENIGLLINSLTKNAKYIDDGLESFNEFELFNNCYSSIRAGLDVDSKAFYSLIKLIQGFIDYSDYLQKLTDFFEIKSDQISHCSKFIKHLNNK
jgi:hypothetical protein